jgi:preprotein translocase subunit SecA
MRLFGTDRLSNLMGKLGMEEGEDIQHPFLTRAIENAQRKVEAMNFDIRKQLLEYDNVMNKQREMVYSLRNQVLEGRDISVTVETMIQESLEEKLEEWTPPKAIPETWDVAALTGWLKHIFSYDGELDVTGWAKLSRPEIEGRSREIVAQSLQAREAELGKEIFPQLQRMILLQMMDLAWKEHLYDLDQLKKGIGLRAYAQKDPLVEFQKEAFRLFQQMMNRIREETLEYLFKVHLAPAPTADGEGAPTGDAPTPAALQPKSVFTGARAEKPEFIGPGSVAEVEEMPQSLPASSSFPSERVPPRNVIDGGPGAPGGFSPSLPSVPSKIGRNDPCPCGSGKKYKKCCGA